MGQSQQCGTTLMHQSSVRPVWRAKGWCYGLRTTDGGFGETWGACVSTEMISSLEYNMTCKTNQPWSNVCWADKVLRCLRPHITNLKAVWLFLLFPCSSFARSFYRFINYERTKETVYVWQLALKVRKDRQVIWRGQLLVGRILSNKYEKSIHSNSSANLSNKTQLKKEKRVQSNATAREHSQTLASNSSKTMWIQDSASLILGLLENSPHQAHTHRFDYASVIPAGTFEWRVNHKSLSPEPVEVRYPAAGAVAELVGAED